MIGGLFEYSAANARVHSIKSLMLQPNEWDTLVSAHDVALTLNALQGTGYGECFDWTSVRPDALPSLRSVEHALRVSTITTVRKLLRFLHGPAGDFLVGLLHRYELLNIKKTFRRLSQPERREHHLELENYRLAPFALVTGVEWDDISTTQELGQVLEPTYFRFAFRKGMQVFSDKHDLLLFEATLEKAYYDELLRRAHALSLVDARDAQHFLGTYFDALMLAATVRLRFQHELDPPAVLPLLSLSGCTLLKEHVFWNMAGAADQDACLEILRNDRRWQHVVGDSLSATVRNLNARLLNQCRRAFVRSSPMQIGPVIALYFLKEREVVDLIALLQMKRFNQPVDQEVLLVPQMLAA